jgi:heme-degrading monooxygenase HmoA
MMLEHALLSVRVGEEPAFEESMREALPLIESAEGCFGAEVRRQAEDDSIYLLLVRWSSIDAHLSFRETELFTAWRSLTHRYYREVPSVTHFHAPLAR